MTGNVNLYRQCIITNYDRLDDREKKFADRVKGMTPKELNKLTPSQFSQLREIARRFNYQI